MKSDRPSFFGGSSTSPLIYRRPAEICQETPRIVYERSNAGCSHTGYIFPVSKNEGVTVNVPGILFSVSYLYTAGGTATTLFCGRSQIEFDLGQFFVQYVLQWLADTDNKTGQWVQAVSDLILPGIRLHR